MSIKSKLCKLLGCDNQISNTVRPPSEFMTVNAYCASQNLILDTWDMRQLDIACYSRSLDIGKDVRVTKGVTGGQINIYDTRVICQVSRDLILREVDKKRMIQRHAESATRRYHDS